MKLTECINFSHHFNISFVFVMTTSCPATLLLLTLQSCVNVPAQVVCLFCLLFFFLRQRESSNPESIQTDPLQIFIKAVENCKPVVGVISMERGGRVFQVRSVLRSRLCVVCALSSDLFSFYLHVYSQTDRRTDWTDRQTDR